MCINVCINVHACAAMCKSVCASVWCGKWLKKTKQRSGRSVDGPSVANAVPSSCTLRINNSTFFQWQGNGFSGCREISFFLGFHCLWKLLPSFIENGLSTARHPMVRLTVNMSSIACEYLYTLGFRRPTAAKTLAGSSGDDHSGKWRFF